MVCRNSWYASNLQIISRSTDPVRVAIGHGLSRATIRYAFDPPSAIWSFEAHGGYECSCEDRSAQASYSAIE
jgi:hypothetical protein